MRQLSPLEYRRFALWTFPTVIDMLSMLKDRWDKLDNETYNERITSKKVDHKGHEVTQYGVKPLDKREFIKCLDKDGYIPFIGHLISTLSDLCPDKSSNEAYNDAVKVMSVLPDAVELPKCNPKDVYCCIKAMQYVMGFGYGNLDKFNKAFMYLAKVALSILVWYLHITDQTFSYGDVVPNETENETKKELNLSALEEEFHM